MKDIRHSFAKLHVGVWTTSFFCHALAVAQLWVEQPSVAIIDSSAAWRRGYIEGYTQSPSIAQVQEVKFKVSTRAAYIPHAQVTSVLCSMTVYRAVGRTLANDIDMNMYRTFQATFYPLRDSVGAPIWPDDPHTRFPRDYRRGCDDLWVTADSFSIPSTWPSGFYYAKLRVQGHDSVGYIPFVVRAASAGDSSKILCVIAWNTYQAYNYWGGGSLYYFTGLFGSEDTSQGTPSIKMIKTVSFRRPFATYFHFTNDGFPLPATNQLGQFDMPYEYPSGTLMHWNRLERSFVSWTHEAGYRMEFCTDADINFAYGQNGIDLEKYKLIVFPGHSEYWSRDQRFNIEKRPLRNTFINGGGNVAFLAADNCYWKVDYRPESPPTNNPDSMYCNKDYIVHGGVSLWRRQRDETTGDSLHEAKFIGAEFLGTVGNQPNIAKNRNHWVFRGVDWQSDSTFGFGDTIHPPIIFPVASGEVDRFISNRSPSNTQILARIFMRQLTDPGEAHYGEVPGDSLYSDCTLYEDVATNSRVFAGGGNGWTPCLFGQDSVRMRMITSNVLDHFSGKKYIGNVYRNLTWSQDQLLRDSVEIDGDSRVIGGRQLLLGNGMKLVIDSAVALFVDGELQIPSGATATITGLNNKWGNLVIDSAGTLRVKSGATLNLVAPLFFVLETGSNLVLESGATLNIRTTTSVGTDVTITVPSGATLRIDQQGGMYFGEGAQLVSYGTLSAIGTSQQPVLFTKLSGVNSGGGISLPSGVDTLEHCRISDLMTGVAIGHSTATLRNNQFVNCGTAIYSDAWKWDPIIEDNTIDSCDIGLDVHTSSVVGVPIIQRDTIRACTLGMVIDASYTSIIEDNRLSNNHVGVLVVNSAPVLHRNIIEDSDSVGVLVLEYGNPRFGDLDSNDAGNNVIRNNAYVQVYSINADPFLGLESGPASFGGYNSVYSETINIRAEDSKEVYAEANWYGMYPPKDEQFEAIESNIYYKNALSEDPNSGMKVFKLSASNEKGTKSDDPALMTLMPEQIQLRQATVLRAQRKYREAVAVYANLISTKPNARESRHALAELRNAYHDYLRWSGDTTLQATLETYLLTQISNHPSAFIKRIARTLRAGEITIRRDFSTAIEEYRQLLQSATVDEDRQMCLFALFSINALGLHNRNEAQSYLTQLQNQFPKDVRAGIAAIRFRGMVDESRGNGMQKSLAGNNEQVQLPLEFGLSQNYPNPFNPVTIVKYAQPVETHTHLKMYDILGREVASLVDEDRPAGYHQVSFDGGRFSSGVYFYRMEAGGFASVKKLLLLK
jgi:hypothetical protein